MDTDLFQILTLFLLLGLLLTLFGVFLSLGAIRKLLEGRPQAASAAPEPAAQAPAPAETSPGDDERPLTWARPDDAAEGSGTQRSGWPSPQEASTAAEPEPSYETPARTEPEPVSSTEPAPVSSAGPEPEDATAREPGARVLYGDTGLTTATPSESVLHTSQPADAEREAEPAAARSGATPDDPQEQPFERDGRWWFRRGDELLVYEEQTGQWVAAGEPSTTGSVAAPSSTGAATTAAPVEGQVTTQQEAVGSFWKCPSCGAVNGSTATSCRMCFTARP